MLELWSTRNKPAEARDACFVGGVEYDWTAGSICDQLFTYTGLIRMTAGGPVTNDVLKCQLKPLGRVDYEVAFTDEQWARLQATFPSGVCDYSKPGVGQAKPRPWLTFADGPGGRRLGKPPVSHSGDGRDITAIGTTVATTTECGRTRRKDLPR